MAGQAWVLALDVGGTKIAGALADPLTGQLRERRECPTQPQRGGPAVLETAVGLARELKAAAEAHRLAVTGIGVAVCELVDRSGAVTSGHTVAWAGLPVTAAFAHLGPAWIEADVRAHAWAEAAWGAGQGLEQFVFVTVGTGISSCLVLHGRPYAGARGSALVMASSPVTTLCPACGNEHWPALEDFAGGPALVARYNARRGARADRAEQVLAAAEAGDQDARWVVSSAGRELGASLAWLVNVLDPQALVIGGGLGSATGLYWEALVASTREHIWSPASRQLPIGPARLGPDAALAGAARAFAVAQPLAAAQARQP